MSEILNKLVELKRQEADLKIGIALAQKEAIAEALKVGQTGTIASIEGAKVVFKLVPVKPKPTDEILEFQKNLEAEKTALDCKYAQKIDSLNYAISILKEKIRLFLQSDRTVYFERQIEELTSELEGEMQPQISVTLPK